MIAWSRPFVFLLISVAGSAAPPAPIAPWSAQRANDWYARQPWLLGANYIPATAINELEMWQAATFQPQRIDRELGWAESIGMNTMRVFLQDQLWAQDSQGFKRRIGQFLAIAAKHHIKPLFVLFDSCWDPNPRLGPQHAPVPGVHNSGWVQSPGARELADASQYPRLKEYVSGIVSAFAADSRILGWDIWNEPDNGNGSSYAKQEPPGKVQLVNALLPQIFAWARAAGATQPLTSGVWAGDWSSDAVMSPTARIQTANSDVISFHSYDNPVELEKRIRSLQRFHRPIICTEYMARGNGSFFEGSLPVGRKYRVAMINWGLVQGKTQTNLPWDSWQHPYVDREPTIWFHEVFFTDGKPYQPEEAQYIRRVASETNSSKALQ